MTNNFKTILGVGLFASALAVSAVITNKSASTDGSNKVEDVKSLPANPKANDAKETIKGSNAPAKYNLSRYKLGDRVVRISGPIMPGGSVLHGAMIISAMQAAKGKVNTLCVMLCASMAAMIHSYGDERLMLDRAILMYHPASGGLEGEVDKMASRLGTIQRIVEKMNRNVANRSKLDYTEFKNRTNVEIWIDAEDALREGFTDKIVAVTGEDGASLFPPPEIGLFKVPAAPQPRRFIDIPFVAPSLNINWEAK